MKCSLLILNNISKRNSSQWAVNIMNFLQGKKEKKVRQIGDPILREQARPVELPTLIQPEFKSMVEEMISVMRRKNGGGISAPQIGVPLQVIAFEVTGYDLKMAMEKYGSKGVSKMQMTLCPLTVLINPKIKVTDPTQVTLRETCLSVEDYSALVPRVKEIKVEALSQEGQNIEMFANGWTARIILHEIDHLQGNLFVDSMIYKSLRNERWKHFKT